MAMKLLMLVIFFAIMVSVGIYARKHATSVDGYVLGGRSVGPWLTAFAYGTSYFSAVVFVGYAGQFGWKYGLASTWIGLGNAIIGSLLAWVVLGRRTKVMTQHLNSKTMPDFFGERYESKALKITASAIVFIFLVPYTASVYNGLSRLFGMAFNIPYKYCVIGMAVFTGIYVILGGYMATAINDFIQGIIMLGGIVAVILAVLNGQGGFIQAIKTMAEIPSDVPVTMGQPGAFTSFFGPDPLNLLGVVILTSLGTWGLPQMVGKFYAIKDEKSINTGTVISTLFAIVISGGCYFLGGFGRLFDAPELHDEAGNMIFDGIIPHMLSTLPDILIGIVVVLVLSASMSTLASLVLTSSSTLTLDFLKDNVMKDMSEKKLTQYRRKHLGYVFQMYNLIANLNVKENIEVGAYLSDNALDIDELLQTLGLYEHRYKLPNQLSGGQQQRVSIGRAIVKNPDILLCDEPTGALDYNTSKEILKLIEDVNKKYGNTIIMVTHNEAIRNMADHVIKLRDGAVRHNERNEHRISAADLEW